MIDQGSANRQAAWRGTAGLSEKPEQLEMFIPPAIPYNVQSPEIRAAMALERIADSLDTDATATKFLTDAMTNNISMAQSEPVAALRVDWRVFGKAKKTGSVNLGTAGIPNGVLYIYVDEGKVVAVEVEQNNGINYTLMPAT